MPTVRDLSEPLAEHLLPVLPDGRGVCAVCGTGPVTRTHCRACAATRLALPAPADAVTAVALAVKGGVLARDLAGYKNARHPDTRARLSRRLTALLWRWLESHEPCLAAAAGVDGAAFDRVTVVPSLRLRRPHPMEVVARRAAPVGPRLATLLVPSPLATAHDLYVAAPLSGQSVLVLDDTWTTGRHAQAAASALHVAGAGRVGVLALGRHFQPLPDGPFAPGAASYLERALAQGWDWDRCPRCPHRQPRKLTDSVSRW